MLRERQQQKLHLHFPYFSLIVFFLTKSLLTHILGYLNLCMFPEFKKKFSVFSLILLFPVIHSPTPVSTYPPFSAPSLPISLHLCGEIHPSLLFNHRTFMKFCAKSPKLCGTDYLSSREHSREKPGMTQSCRCER